MTDQTDEKAEKKSASTVLVEIAEELYVFGVSDGGDTFAVPRSGPKVVRLLRGGKTSLRAQLSREYFRRVGKAAPQQALADALLVVEGIAQDEPEQRLYLRVAGHEGAFWLDLGDASGAAVRIDGRGWTVQQHPPMLFRRTALNSVLPEPERGGDLGDLWRWLNVSAADRPLVAAWLVATLFCDIPHPILGVFGEQGTGKTTAGKVLVSVLDPSPVPARKPPRDADTWVNAAAGSWVVGLDNMSDMPPWLSDSLCRAVTGDGDVRRKLYTDSDMHVFAFRRCLVLNGIDLGALRGDLAERLLPIHLAAITDDRRLPENRIWPAWRQAHPRLLGAVLDLVAGVAGALPSVRLERNPRMADFAGILAAVDKVMGTEGLARYLAKQGEIAADSLTGDPFISAIGATIGDIFTGTSTALLETATPNTEGWKPPKGWPGTARSVTKLLNRQAPVMRKAGWTIHHDDGRNKDKVLQWTIAPPRTQMAREEPPPHPPHPPNGIDQQKQAGGVAGIAGLADQQAGIATPASATIPAVSPPTNDGISAGQGTQAGQAGIAGIANGPSQDGRRCRQCHRRDGWRNWPEPDLCGGCARGDAA